MKKFERFIVYPLLIITLFFSMSGNQVMTEADQIYDEIIANKIKIVNNEGKEMITLGVKEDNSSNVSDHGEIIVMQDTSKYKSKLQTRIENGRILLNYFDDKSNNEANSYTSLFGGSVNMKSNNNLLHLGENYRNFPDGFINDEKNGEYDLSYGFGIDMYFKEKQEDAPVVTENSTLTVSNNEHGSSINTYNKDGNPAINIGTTEGDGGIIDIYNKHENKIISLTQTAPDDEEEGGNHGLITIFDKYGEDFKNYSFR